MSCARQFAGQDLVNQTRNHALLAGARADCYGFDVIAAGRAAHGTVLDEELRLRTLYCYDILDTVEETAFDDVCSIAATLCEAPTSLISLVDRRRQWFKARVNFDEKETEIECSFCVHAVEQGELLVVQDAARDGRFVHNRLVISGPQVRFYAGAPLRAPNGQLLGTLCVIDSRPRTLTEDQTSALRSLAKQVEALLEVRRLSKDKELLGRFVIHDMRNPLTSMMAGIDSAVDEFERGNLESRDLLELQQSTEVLRRRVEDYHTLLAECAGLLPTKIEVVDLKELFRQLEGSMRKRLTPLDVTLSSHIQEPTVWADFELVRRTLENLIYNALHVAPSGSTITVDSWSTDEGVHLAVTDEGPGIPEGKRHSIFDSLLRDKPREPRTSSGLGLAFCALSARTLGGTIVCESPPSGNGARFRLTFPAPT